MRIYENGIYRDATPEEIAELSKREPVSYEARVVELIRMRYNVDDELAILRQREQKPEEYQAYFDYAEACKVQAKTEMEEQL